MPLIAKLFEYLLFNPPVEISKNSEVIKFSEVENEIEVTVRNKNNEIETYSCSQLFFTNPLLQFVKIFEDKNSIPKNVIDATNSLKYRHHISVHITIDEKLFEDNWIYIHSQILWQLEYQILQTSLPVCLKNTYTLTVEYFFLKRMNFGLKAKMT